MFEKVLGQERIKKIISNQIRNNKVSYAYMFSGIDGIGKNFVATEFAKIMNCDTINFNKINPSACDGCISCEKITKNIHPDVHFINFKKQQNIFEQKKIKKQKLQKIEIIVDKTKKKILTKAYEGKWKFFIIDCTEKSNIMTLGLFAKILEDKVENTIIIFIVNNIYAVPRAIISRLQVMFFKSLSTDDISNWLASNYLLSSSKIKNISFLSDGSIGYAKKYVDKKNEDDILFSWNKFMSGNLSISDALYLSKNISINDSALKCVDVMIREAKEKFILLPETSIIIKLLIDYRVLLSTNTCHRIILDNLFIDLFDLQKKIKFNI